MSRRSSVPGVAGSTNVAPAAKSPFQSPPAAMSMAASARRAHAFQSTEAPYVEQNPVLDKRGGQMDSVALLQRVVDQTTEVVDNIEPGQLGNATPCTEWTVRD